MSKKRIMSIFWTDATESRLSKKRIYVSKNVYFSRVKYLIAMKKILTVLAFAAMFFSAGAEEIRVNSFRYDGPYPVNKPFIVDSLDVNSKAFDVKSFLDAALSSNALKDSKTFVSGEPIPGYEASTALHWAGFSVQSASYVKAKVKVEGLENYKLFADGKEAKGEFALSPGTHEFSVKYLSEPGKTESMKVTLTTESEGKLSIREDGKHSYGMMDVLLGKRYGGVQVSPDGKYMIVSYRTTFEGGKSEASTQLVEIASGRAMTVKDDIRWMPSSNKYYFTRKTLSGNELVAADPATGIEEILAEDIPQGRFQLTPSEDAMIYTMHQEGPKEKEEIYQILTPDDRQPGWRSRSYSSRYDLKTGVMQQLTFGYNDSYIADVSPDGKTALLFVSKERLTERPTTVGDLYLFDLQTLQAKLLVKDDGFLGGAEFSPDGSKALIEGSPEAFEGIGMNVREGQTPNTYDQQLFIMDLSSGKVKAMTRNFNPAVTSSAWSKADGMIYFTAENMDCISLYKLNPNNGKISQLESREDLVNDLSIASAAPVMAYYGQGAMNSDRLYTVDLKSGKTALYEDLSAEILKNVDLGECLAWTFKNDNGENVCARYYLPPHFDASRKYPMIVNYYGGCSPTSRNFESRYPHHAYAALGYVVLVIAVPSGATGAGQEWSARHVNTAGEGPAQDIITGAKTFCAEHSFVDEKKVGCIGASYGGFMSQYIPTLTDFFACSVSHAGISDHTSYWGFGYWGYSYSETSMANSYPWSRPDLYVERSPLYRADKINTPLLFVHGDADTNVPFNESVQMFTALKLLGKETAFVAVKDQNHHILDYQKRLEWQDTIWAWFAKWLQDDPTWWDALYSPKSL